MDMTKTLTYKVVQSIWHKIDKAEREYIPDEKYRHVEELKSKGDTISQDDLLKELRIDKGEI